MYLLLFQVSNYDIEADANWEWGIMLVKVNFKWF